MLTEFKNRRGYDLTTYMPCLAGRVVGNSGISDGILWDFRRTFADMFAENHYAVLTEYLNKHLYLINKLSSHIRPSQIF
ncbi:MAG: hypothetical protein KA114_09210 [Bacteroidales bacterium]|nr:hypothetical protein [Bacteroidales bacterium]HCI55542.1 hypothetical protein [Bacteroidales bacterium]